MIINIDTSEYTVEVRDEHVSVVLKDTDGNKIELRLPKEPIKIPLSGYVKELHSARAEKTGGVHTRWIWPGLRFP